MNVVGNESRMVQQFETTMSTKRGSTKDMCSAAGSSPDILFSASMRTGDGILTALMLMEDELVLPYKVRTTCSGNM